MSNRISGILMVTLIALCAIIVMEARSGVPSAESLKVTPQKHKSAAVAGPLRVTLPPLAALSETIERPLFSETRRPPEVESDDALVSPAEAPVEPSAKFVLFAIIITDDERAVLVANPQGGEPIRVAEGDTIAGWQLDSVKNDRAIFSMEGEIQEVALRTFGPPPPPRPQRPTATPPRANSPEEALRRALREKRLRSQTSEKETAPRR
jgi:hypothetical protein